MKLDRRYCRVCGEMGPAIYSGPNHVLHGILTLLVCGFWLPIWILLALFGGTWHCQRCGAEASAAGPGRAGSGGGAVAWIVGALVSVMCIVGAAFVLVGVFGQMAPRQDPALQGLAPAQQEAAKEWDRKVAREQRDAANAEIAARRAKLKDPPAEAEPVENKAPAEEPISEPVVVLPADGVPAAWKEADAKLEAKAKAQLALAKTMLTSGGNAKNARARLQKVIDDFPDTKAAAEAADLLKK